MYLGIDTSCYTTSVAIVSDSGEVVADKRIVLTVGEGKRGLRQSEGVFQHMKNLPVLIEEIKEYLPEVKAIAVSGKPRNTEDSYMPVFLAGMSFARAISASLNVPIIFTDHQSGHIMAASKSAGLKPVGEFVAIHLSGGTTEILLINGDKAEIIGKTLDIPAGQLVDRTGVMCGVRFPCGKEMDREKLNTTLRLPVSVKKCDINFSGAEIQAQKLYGEGAPCGELFTAVFKCIGISLEKAVKNAGDYHVLPVGGVSSNTVIREHLIRAFGEKMHFAKPEYMTDNAVGVAYIGRDQNERYLYNY